MFNIGVWPLQRVTSYINLPVVRPGVIKCVNKCANVISHVILREPWKYNFVLYSHWKPKACYIVSWDGFCILLLFFFLKRMGSTVQICIMSCCLDTLVTMQQTRF